MLEFATDRPSPRLWPGRPTQTNTDNKSADMADLLCSWPSARHNMKNREEDMNPNHELDEEDKDHIRAVFDDEVVPKLVRLNARLGNLSCGFAGQEYEHWTIEFRSKGDNFEIVSFEYDEEAVGLDLGL